MNRRTLIIYGLAIVLVGILGGLAGWYFFLNSRGSLTTTGSAGRGLSIPAIFGGSGSPSTPSTAVGTATQNPVQQGPTRPPQLWHITNAPAAGIALSTSSIGVEVRYVERSNGFVFGADPMTSAVKRLANTLTPKVYEALFMQSGRIIERSLDQTGAITTFVGSLSSASTTNATSTPLTGVSIDKDIVTLAVDPISDQILSLRKNGTGVVAFKSAWNGDKPKQLFASTISGWKIWWLADGRIVIVQSAIDSIPGYSYTVASDGAFTPILKPLPGLSMLPRTNSSALLYATSIGGRISLFVQASGTANPVALPIRTLPEKCVWAPGTALIVYCAVPQALPSGEYVGAWYRGEVHTADAFWQIDATAGVAQLIYTPNGNISIDVEQPSMDGTGSYIAFLNAADKSPWLLRLNK